MGSAWGTHLHGRHVAVNFGEGLKLQFTATGKNNVATSASDYLEGSTYTLSIKKGVFTEKRITENSKYPYGQYVPNIASRMKVMQELSYVGYKDFVVSDQGGISPHHPSKPIFNFYDQSHEIGWGVPPCFYGSNIATSVDSTKAVSLYPLVKSPYWYRRGGVQKVYYTETFSDTLTTIEQAKYFYVLTDFLSRFYVYPINIREENKNENVTTAKIENEQAIYFLDDKKCQIINLDWGVCEVPAIATLTTAPHQKKLKTPTFYAVDLPEINIEAFPPSTTSLDEFTGVENGYKDKEWHNQQHYLWTFNNGATFATTVAHSVSDKPLEWLTHDDKLTSLYRCSAMPYKDAIDAVAFSKGVDGKFEGFTALSDETKLEKITQTVPVVLEVAIQITVPNKTRNKETDEIPLDEDFDFTASISVSKQLVATDTGHYYIQSGYSKLEQPAKDGTVHGNNLCYAYLELFGTPDVIGNEKIHNTIFKNPVNAAKEYEEIPDDVKAVPEVLEFVKMLISKEYSLDTTKAFLRKTPSFLTVIEDAIQQINALPYKGNGVYLMPRSMNFQTIHVEQWWMTLEVAAPFLCGDSSAKAYGFNYDVTWEEVNVYGEKTTPPVTALKRSALQTPTVSSCIEWFLQKYWCESMVNHSSGTSGIPGVWYGTSNGRATSTIDSRFYAWTISHVVTAIIQGVTTNGVTAAYTYGEHRQTFGRAFTKLLQGIPSLYHLNRFVTPKNFGVSSLSIWLIYASVDLLLDEVPDFDFKRPYRDLLLSCVSRALAPTEKWTSIDFDGFDTTTSFLERLYKPDYFFFTGMLYSNYELNVSIISSPSTYTPKLFTTLDASNGAKYVHHVTHRNNSLFSKKIRDISCVLTFVECVKPAVPAATGDAPRPIRGATETVLEKAKYCVLKAKNAMLTYQSYIVGNLPKPLTKDRLKQPFADVRWLDNSAFNGVFQTIPSIILGGSSGDNIISKINVSTYNNAKTTDTFSHFATNGVIVGLQLEPSENSHISNIGSINFLNGTVLFYGHTASPMGFPDSFNVGSAIYKTGEEKPVEVSSVRQLPVPVPVVRNGMFNEIDITATVLVKPTTTQLTITNFNIIYQNLDILTPDITLMLPSAFYSLSFEYTDPAINGKSDATFPIYLEGNLPTVKPVNTFHFSNASCIYMANPPTYSAIASLTKKISVDDNVYHHSLGMRMYYRWKDSYVLDYIQGSSAISPQLNNTRGEKIRDEKVIEGALIKAKDVFNKVNNNTPYKDSIAADELFVKADDKKTDVYLASLKVSNAVTRKNTTKGLLAVANFRKTTLVGSTLPFSLTRWTDHLTAIKAGVAEYITNLTKVYKTDVDKIFQDEAAALAEAQGRAVPQGDLSGLSPEAQAAAIAAEQAAKQRDIQEYQKRVAGQPKRREVADAKFAYFTAKDVPRFNAYIAYYDGISAKYNAAFSAAHPVYLEKLTSYYDSLDDIDAAKEDVVLITRDMDQIKYQLQLLNRDLGILNLELDSLLDEVHSLLPIPVPTPDGYEDSINKLLADAREKESEVDALAVDKQALEAELSGLSDDLETAKTALADAIDAIKPIKVAHIKAILAFEDAFYGVLAFPLASATAMLSGAFTAITAKLTELDTKAATAVTAAKADLAQKQTDYDKAVAKAKEKSKGRYYSDYNYGESCQFGAFNAAGVWFDLPLTQRNKKPPPKPA